MYKSKKGLDNSAYCFVKDFGSSSMEYNILKFTNPADGATHASSIAVTLVEGSDTTQIPIQISATEAIGLPSDVYLSVSDLNTESTDNCNKFRRMSKWIDDLGGGGGWRHTSLGDELYLSTRSTFVEHSTNDSSFHTEDYGYFYRMSFVYDGFQESPLGASFSIKSIGKKVSLNLLFTTDNFPKRVTALRIYRGTSISTNDRNLGGFYHFVTEIDITTAPENSIPNYGTITEHMELSTAESRLIEYEDSGVAGATYETMSGLFEAMTDSNVQYSLSTQLNSSLFVANCNHHSQANARNIIYKSLPFKPSCINWALDFLKLPGIPTAIQAFNGRIYAFTKNSTIKIDPNSMYIEDVYTGAGCSGPDAVIVSDFGMCYADANNIYHHTGNIPIPIGDSILTSDNSIGYLDLLASGTAYSVPKISFDATRKCFVVFINQTRAWSYNVVRKSWNLWETPNLKGVTVGRDGEILGAAVSDNRLYKLFQDSTRLAWSWTSKKLSMRHKTQKKRWYEQIVSYEGTAPTVNVYWDEAGSSATIASGTSESNIIRKQLGNTATAVNHRLIQTKIDGSADTEVDSVGFTFRRFASLIDQGSPT